MNLINKLIPFLIVFVWAQEGLAKTPSPQNMYEVIQSLQENYIPYTHSSFKKIPIKNYKRGKNYISFQSYNNVIRINWNLAGTKIKLNGFLIDEKILKNKKRLRKKINKLINGKQWALFQLLIPQAKAAMPPALSQGLTQLLQRLLLSIRPMMAYNVNSTNAQPRYTSGLNSGSMFYEGTRNPTPEVTAPETRMNEHFTTFRPQPQTRTTERPQEREITTTTPEAGCATGYDAQECEVVNLVNAERRRRGLSTLSIDQNCTALAASHATDMAQNGFFSHTSPQNGTFQARARRFQLRGGGENIARASGSASSIMQMWMNSSGHRSNILKRNFTEIGVSRSGNNWVQCFSM